MKLRPNGHAVERSITGHTTQKPPNHPKKQQYRSFFRFFVQTTMDSNSDSDFEPQELFDNDTTTPTLRRRRATTPVELSGAKSGRKKAKTDTTFRKPKFLPDTIKGCATKLQHLRALSKTKFSPFRLVPAKFFDLVHTRIV